MHALSFWQQVNKTANCFNNTVLILVAKISCKKSLWKKWKRIQMSLIETPVFAVGIGTAFDSKVISFRRMRKKHFIILQIINKEVNAIKTYPPFFLCLLLSNINWKSTERTYGSAVFKVLHNIITICVFIA